MNNYKKILKQKSLELGIRTLVGAVVGLICGFFGYLFHYLIEIGTDLRLEHTYILFLMPVAGLIIVLINKLLKTDKLGTSDVIKDSSTGTLVSIFLFPAMFIGTVLTHFVGGSAGREGAALQIGGSIGSSVSRIFKLRKSHIRVANLSGMAAFFTALFGTPIAATTFVMMISYVGISVYEMYVPVFISSLCAYFLSVKLGVAPTRFMIDNVDISLIMVLKISLLAVILGLVAILFFKTIHFTHHKFGLIKNEYLRIIIGSAIIILITYLFGDMRYSGAGMGVIVDAIEKGKALPYDFVLKIVLTALTLGCGFKGGEVVPSFFVGATLGAFVGPLIGINPGFAAAIGLVSVFCAATNSPLPSILLGIELFNGKCALYMALACLIAYIVSGRDGFYNTQKTFEESDLDALIDKEFL